MTIDANEKNRNTPSGDLVIRTLAMPKDTNANGDIFCGWILSQMDLGAAILAKHVAKQRIVTVAIDEMSFLAPVRVGDMVSCYARLLKVGRTSMKIGMELWVQRDDSDEKSCVTHGEFTYVAINEQGEPVPVKAD